MPMIVASRRLTDFGVVRPGAKYPTLALTRDHPRFADVRAIRLGTMPKVRVGQVWADQDPRCAGRTVEIVDLLSNGKALVKTLTPRTTPPRTSSGSPRDTVGTLTEIAVRRFRPGSRGFTLVEDAPKPSKRRAARTAPARKHNPATTGAARHPTETAGPEFDRVDAIASLLAAGNPVLNIDRRAAAALVGLLGDDHAVSFLVDGIRAQGQSPVRRYCDEGLAALLSAAVVWASRKGLIAEWAQPKKTANA